MTRNGHVKPLGQASRRLQARIRPAPVLALTSAAPEPRDSISDERQDPATVGELFRQRVNVDEGETLALSFIEWKFPIRYEPLPSTKQGHHRRRYGPEERRGVADTRRRGACEGCRASKKKCRHVPSKTATDKYRTHPQSHELFALGLTTTSRAANEHEHKQVMEEKIAEFDDKLVKAQKESSTPEIGANNNGGVKAAPRSPQETAVPKGPPGQQNHPVTPVEVHQTQARLAVPPHFQQGMGMSKFKLNNASKQQPKQGSSKDSTDITLGRKHVDARKTSVSQQPIVCQEPSKEIVRPPTAAKLPYNKNSRASHPNARENINGRCAMTVNTIQPGCRAFQKSFSSHLEAPNAFSSQSRSEQYCARRSSNNSEQDTRTIATDESMLSLGRSSSPSSEPPPSKPPSFVHLSDLEHSKTDNRIVPGSQIAIWQDPEAHEQTSASTYDGMDLDDSDDNPPSFEAYLNNGLNRRFL